MNMYERCVSSRLFALVDFLQLEKMWKFHLKFNTLQIWYVPFHLFVFVFSMFCFYSTFAHFIRCMVHLRAYSHIFAWVFHALCMYATYLHSLSVCVCAFLDLFTSIAVVVAWIVLNGFQNSPNFVISPPPPPSLRKHGSLWHEIWAMATSNCPCRCGQQLSSQLCIQMRGKPNSMACEWRVQQKRRRDEWESEQNWQHQIKSCNHCSWWTQFSFRV